MKKAIAAAVFFSLTSGTLGPRSQPRLHPTAYSSDPRLSRLKAFLQAHRSPLYAQAHHFLGAADLYGLDWRLLPAIAVLETGAGRTARNNNFFGWASGERLFPSAPYAIHWVAWRLARSPLYRGRTLDAVLRTYNPHPNYARRVAALMRRLGNVEQLRSYPSRK